MNMYNPVEQFFMEVDKKIKAFLWGKGAHRIKYTVLQQDIAKGGLKLINVRNKCYSLKVKWIKEAIGSKSFWAIRSSEVTPLPLIDMINCNLSPQYIGKLCGETIWKDILGAWCKYKYKSKSEIVEDVEVILNQQLWLNSFICAQGKPLLNKNFLQRGIQKIGDIMDIQGKCFLTWQEISLKFGLKEGFLEYFMIISSIPREWKVKIKWEVNEENIKMDIPEIALEKEKITSFVYGVLMEKQQIIDVGKIIWEKELQCMLDDVWERIRIHMFQLTPLTKLRYFQYRVLSSKLITNYHRSKWDKTVSPFCTFGCQEMNTMVHLLVECPIVKKLWKGFSKWLSNLLKIDLKLNKKDIILNYYKGQYGETVNTVIIVVKQYIYSKSCFEEQINFMGALTRVQDYHKIEKITLFKL